MTEMTNPLFPARKAEHVYCMADQCAACEACVRHSALTALPEGQIAALTLLPREAKPEAGRDCPYFLSNEPVRFAFGFEAALGSVRVKDKRSVMGEIARLSSQRTSYRLLRGERAMPPETQEVIAEILVRHGATVPVAFDRYEERAAWGK